MAELDYGGWEGLTLEQIDEKFRASRAYDADPASYHVGGRERATGCQATAFADR